MVVFLAFWSLQGPLLTWCLGGNGLELVSSSRPRTYLETPPGEAPQRARAASVGASVP